MGKLKYIIIGIIFFAAALTEATLRYITPPLIDSFYNYPFFQKILEWLSANPFLTAAVARTIWVSQIIIGIFLYPRAYIREKKETIIKHIYSDLFGEDIRQHRVTLFKEICYPHALWRYLCAVCFHMRPKYFRRFRLHISYFPCPGQYLIINVREGIYKRSRTMFRVEEDIEEKCQGIVGRIRFLKGTGTVVNDLPDITNIDLYNIDLSNPRKNETKIVSEYMNKGYIKDINSLRRLHMKARHFLGSVIYRKGGKPWGMLLVDSIAPNSPFNDALVDKFKIYSQVLTDIVS